MATQAVYQTNLANLERNWPSWEKHKSKTAHNVATCYTLFIQKRFCDPTVVNVVQFAKTLMQGKKDHMKGHGLNKFAKKTIKKFEKGRLGGKTITATRSHLTPLQARLQREGEITQLRNQLETTSETLTGVQEQLATVSDNLRGAQEESERLQEQIDTLNRGLADRDVNNRALQQQLNALNDGLTASEENRRNLSQVLGGHTVEINRLVESQMGINELLMTLCS